ncbi:hypothetical protein CRYUN_Cryun35bG0081300 [Craigia yunnanensis]
MAISVINIGLFKIDEVDESVTVECRSSDDQSFSSSYDEEENQKSSSERKSSVLEIFQTNELSVTSTPRRGLDHCITAPVGAHRNLLIDDNEISFSRSMTEKKTPRHDLKIDRLSEREKKKLIVNLVKIQNDRTVEVNLAKNSPVASELLELSSIEGAPFDLDDTSFYETNKSIPRLKIAILVVGTRGDVQPFLAMAKILQEFGHHVRLATHANFSSFVKSAGIDFYPLGVDSRVLAGHMARNKGFILSGPGEISIQRKELKAIIESLLPACTERDIETGMPFSAQAIIANPPAYGHAHVAETLGVPLHIFFTMPWTPTYEFPHPLACVPQSARNWVTFLYCCGLTDMVGHKGINNDFRKKKLKFAPIAYFSTYSGSISQLPTGYIWSSHLVPKPKDWGPLVDVVGYCFLNLGSKYQPQEEFVEWIQKGSQPIYIGFGSMVCFCPAVTEVPENVFLLEDCHHDWLFPQCSAVVHHGGAGTTVTGLKAGFFWGDRVHQRGLGPAPIPISQLSVKNLSNAIRFMLQPEVKSHSAKLIENEDGVAAAVDAFHQHLPPELPLPTAPSEENDHPNPFQWFFPQIGKLCSLPCGLWNS